MWVFRYYADRADGRRVEKNYVLATVRECPSETSAWKKVHELDLQTRINKPGYEGPT